MKKIILSLLLLLFTLGVSANIITSPLEVFYVFEPLNTANFGDAALTTAVQSRFNNTNLFLYTKANNETDGGIIVNSIGQLGGTWFCETDNIFCFVAKFGNEAWVYYNSDYSYMDIGKNHPWFSPNHNALSSFVLFKEEVPSVSDSLPFSWAAISFLGIILLGKYYEKIR